jgi:hypothetical protein
MQFPKSLSNLASVAEGARSDGWVKALPWVVSAGLVVLLAWQLVQLAWTLLDKTHGLAGPTGPATAAPTPAARTVDVPAIINARLFGAGGSGRRQTDPESVAPHR